MKVETCFICKTGINISEDNFVEIKEFKLGKFFNSIFAHVNCWRDNMSNKRMLSSSMALAGKTLGKADKMLQEAGY